MEISPNQDVAALLDSLEDVAQAAELTNHEIAEIAEESNEQIDIASEHINSIVAATDAMVADLEKIETQVAEELDTLMLDALSDVDVIEPEA